MRKCVTCGGMVDNRTKRKGHDLPDIVRDGKVCYYSDRAIHFDCEAQRAERKAALAEVRSKRPHSPYMTSAEVLAWQPPPRR